MKQTFIPELLSPAGGLDKLKMAVDYGADAVYLGGQEYGLRAAAENFTSEQLIEGVRYAHQNQSKVYVTLNSFFHDEDFSDLLSFLKFLEEIKVDAVIVSDIGVINYIIKNTQLCVHLSTQASCVNEYAAKAYADMGVSRLVLGREVSLNEAGKIKKYSGLEIELFIHGSMCMAYSGQCVISNFTAGRDSNRGGCAHSCRFEYELDFDGKKKVETTFMSSKDLNGLELLNHYSLNEIDSIKVEGRMKSVHYVSTVSKVYRKALDLLEDQGQIERQQYQNLQNELLKLSHRDYTIASLVDPAGSESIYDERNYDPNDMGIVGEILEVVNQDFCLVKVRTPIQNLEKIEIMPFEENNIVLDQLELLNVLGEKMDKANPGRLIRIPYFEGLEERNIIRRFN